LSVISPLLPYQLVAASLLRFSVKGWVEEEEIQSGEEKKEEETWLQQQM